MTTIPSRRREVPLCRPEVTDEDVNAVVEVLRSGWLAHGSCNHEFEREFAKVVGVPHAISLNSCTSALELALKAHDIRGEVILPSFTWVATANAVLTTGGTPVFVDVDRATRNVTAGLIEAAITPRTEAVIVVHYGGQPCAMTDIIRLCERHKLLLIEDSAETLGATWEGRQAGSFGLGCFSFFPTKNITTAEGGMLTCQDDAIAEKIRALAAHGIASSTHARERAEKPWLRIASMAGHNYRMPNPLAALGLSQLRRLESMNARRIRAAAIYDNLLARLGGPIETPITSPGAVHTYQMYTILTPGDRRDGLLQRLRKEGIGASAHFTPAVHQQEFYAPWVRSPLPGTEDLAARLVTLPMYPGITEEDQAHVVEVIAEHAGSRG